jgi:hypothetical protein
MYGPQTPLSYTPNTGINYGINYAGQTGYAPNPYPAYRPTAPNAPGGASAAPFVGNAPLQTISIPSYAPYAKPAPTYEGMMGSDYDAWQRSLTTPGEIAARTAYDRGLVNLNNYMGGQGLYGSSIMANQARTAIDTPYMNAMQTNAAQSAATRYGMQQADVQNKNVFGLDVYGKQLGEHMFGQNFGLDAAKAAMTQEMNRYNSGVTDASRQQDYGQYSTGIANSNAAAQSAWANQQALEQFQYNLALMGYGNQQQMNQLGLMGNANAISAQQAAIDAQNRAAMLGAAGTAAGIGYDIYRNW